MLNLLEKANQGDQMSIVVTHLVIISDRIMSR